MFTLAKTIHLHDTDAAGRLYFAHLFRLAHEGYEALMAALGFPIADLVKGGRLALPIVRAEADYKLPLAVGDVIALELKPTRVGQTSFTILCRITRHGQTVGRVKTVHVAVDAKKGEKCPLPARLQKALLTVGRR
jgi:1,4-dihydroxy-2-naphthoyl-CoA hydrolase